MLKIIDISSYQDPKFINYDTLAKNVDGVILRVGFTGWGTGESYNKDKHFETHYKELKARKVPVGAYWFSCANEPGEGTAEAKQVLRHIKGKTFELPIYFDTEDEYHQRPSSARAVTDQAIEFLTTLEEEGYFVGVYASASWYQTELEKERLTSYTLWVAHYGLSEEEGVRRYLTDGKYDMWQYTGTGRIAGYGNNIDINILKRDLADVIVKGGFNGFKKQDGKLDPKEPETPKQGGSVENNDKETTTTRNYKVIRGDTLGQIANRFGTTVDAIMKLNPQIKNRNLIYPNQVIQLQEVRRKYYKIEKGDTFSKIANAHGLTVKQLQELNPRVKNINLIYPNQFLRVK